VFRSAFQVLQSPRIPKLEFLQQCVKGGRRQKSNAVQFNLRAVLGNRAQVDGRHRFAEVLGMLKIRRCLHIAQNQQLLGHIGDNRVLDVSGLPPNRPRRVTGFDQAADTEIDPCDRNRPALPAFAADQELPYFADRRIDGNAEFKHPAPIRLDERAIADVREFRCGGAGGHASEHARHRKDSK